MASRFLKNKYGFSGLEILTVIAIVGIVSAFTFPIMKNFSSSATIYEVLSEIESMLRMARLQSTTGYYDTSHGVYFDLDIEGHGTATLYQGSSYYTRDSEYDSVYEFRYPISINLTATGNDIKFDMLDGLPSASGTIMVINESANAKKKINISEIGLISDTVF